MLLKQVSKHIIFSPSGWRAIINSNPHAILSIFYYGIHAYIQHKRAHNTSPLNIALGSDTRFYSKVLLPMAIDILQTYEQVNITYLGTIPIPAIMAYTRIHADGFIYFTASHNPPEYNGIKFGSHEGKTQSAEDHSNMMNIFHTIEQQVTDIPPQIANIDNQVPMYDNTPFLPLSSEDSYQHALHAYISTIFEAVFRGLENPTQEFKTRLEQYIQSFQKSSSPIEQLGIIWDPNGGARTWELDRGILSSLGVLCKYINAVPKIFAHPIIPEGESLSHAIHTLKDLNTYSPILYLFAVVCDCDGDRGNMVFLQNYLSKSTSDINVLTPQEVFALALKIELAWTQYINSKHHNTHKPIAVVVNGPSSLRCNHIAQEYGATLFRCEVGEANIVSQGEILRSKNFDTPLIGEASNGGVIMPPSSVRDPLCTTLSLLKGILWAEELDLSPNLNTTIQQLPQASSTPTEDPLAKLQIPPLPFNEIITKIARHFHAYFPYIQEVFNIHDIIINTYQYIHFQGTQSTILNSSYNTPQALPYPIHSGGFAIHFYRESTIDHTSIPHAFLWLRPSGTEPVVRIMADVQGAHSKPLERLLIQAWHTYLQNTIYHKH